MPVLTLRTATGLCSRSLRWVSESLLVIFQKRDLRYFQKEFIQSQSLVDAASWLTSFDVAPNQENPPFFDP